MPKVETVPAQYTITLSQSELDSLRSILRRYVDPPESTRLRATEDSRKEDIAWLTEALWDESVWDAPWTY